MAIKIRPRNGTAAGWSSANPTLLAGEIGTTTDTPITFKIGDGATAWNSLVAAPSAGPVQTLPHQSFGDGSDGNATIVFAVLTRDMYYNNLSFATNGVLVPAGYRVFVKGRLDLSGVTWGAIRADGSNGGAASGATGGAIGLATSSNVVGGGGSGTAGATGTTGAGTTSGALVGVNGNGGSTSNCGAGGTSGTGNAGGGASNGTTPTVTSFRGFTTHFVKSATLWGGGGGGRGGSSGGGDGTNAGGGGGAGGNGGAALAIYANTIVTSSTTGPYAIRANGGDGGAGAGGVAGSAGGGGGASGGGGGYIYLAYNYKYGPKIPNLIQSLGGLGGAGGAGAGTGTGGASGISGSGGRIYVFNVPNTSGTVYNPVTSNIYDSTAYTLNPAVASAGGSGTLPNQTTADL